MRSPTDVLVVDPTDELVGTLDETVVVEFDAVREVDPLQEAKASRAKLAVERRTHRILRTRRA